MFRKTRYAVSLMMASALFLGGASATFAHPGYTVDPSDVVVRDGSGECVRTPRWTLEGAIEGCYGFVAPAPMAAAFEAPAPRIEVVVLDARVLFAINKYELTPAATSELNRVADRILQAGTQIESVTINGHTDNTGSRALNERLSKNRADSVKQFMVNRGISSDLIETAGYAFDRPVASNATAEGRQANRRVEVIIKLKEEVTQ